MTRPPMRAAAMLLSRMQRSSVRVERPKAICKRGRGRNIRRVMAELTLALRGWVNYFKLSSVKKTFDELDQWIRHRLRCIIWRQWKRPWTRFRNLIKLGLDEERAAMSAWNGRGEWWNSGASHVNQALPISYFEKLGLLSLYKSMLRFQSVS